MRGFDMRPGGQRLEAGYGGGEPAPGKRTLTEELGEDDDSAHADGSSLVRATGGRPIEDDIRAAMERAFGADFSRVRIHEDDAAESIGAEAFTRGQDVHFAPGRYDPYSAAGRELLGHELAHVVQQGEGRVAAPSEAKGAAIRHDAALEREADAQGAKAAAGDVARTGAPVAPSTDGPVQCVITIGKERFTHGSKKLNTLYAQIVMPALEQGGFKTYGVKSRLVEFVRTSNAVYGDPAAFLAAFLPWLATQTRAVKGGKQTPVLKKFSVMGMSRPGWPDAVKQQKGVQPGDNVRHVVRNATLKRALDIHYEKVPEASRKAYFSQFAALLGGEVGDASLPDIVQALYKLLYLNGDNLFSGDGPMNQVIGFSADAVTAIGEELLAAGEEPVSLIAVYKRVMLAIHGQAAKVKAAREQLMVVVSEIDGTVLEALSSLVPDGADRADPSQLVTTAEAAGDLVANIGLNFGFDLIDGRTDEDQSNIGERQRRLIWAETALQEFIASKGASGSLLEIFGRFMDKAVGFGTPDKAQGASAKQMIAMLDKEMQEKLAKLVGDNPSPDAVLKALASAAPNMAEQVAKGRKGAGALVRETVDQGLAALGYRRRPSDAFGFICLVDSIHQLLTFMGIAVNRQTLIDRVRVQTGTQQWQMLDILGAQGAQVLQAVEHVVHAATGTHYRFEANVMIAMPDSSLVPFLGANRFAPAAAGATRIFNLLYLDNNHFEPLLSG